jgi:hypothetical protein
MKTKQMDNAHCAKGGQKGWKSPVGTVETVVSTINPHFVFYEKQGFKEMAIQPTVSTVSTATPFGQREGDLT